MGFKKGHRAGLQGQWFTLGACRIYIGMLGMKNRQLSKFWRSAASRARPICAVFLLKNSFHFSTMGDTVAESGQAYKCSASLRFTDFRCDMVLRGRVSHRHRGSRAHLAVSLCCHGRSICAALVSFLFTALGRGALGGWVEALVFSLPVVQDEDDDVIRSGRDAAWLCCE